MMFLFILAVLLFGFSYNQYVATSFHHSIYDKGGNYPTRRTDFREERYNNNFYAYEWNSGRTQKQRTNVVRNSCIDDHHFNHDDRIILEPQNKRAYPQQTPHSGRHFELTTSSTGKFISTDSSNTFGSIVKRKIQTIIKYPKKYMIRQGQSRRRRFTEGWYYRLTLPTHNDTSFAFIISIEDPGQMISSPLHLVCIQCIGPNNEYIVQGQKNDTLFWAWKYQQGLGYIFKNNPNTNIDVPIATALQLEYWNDIVESGFQILPNHIVGRVRGKDGTIGDNTIVDINNDRIQSCDFNFCIDPICGWGGTTEREQKSTAGWLSYYPIFEPHWQITLADARASGTVIWNNTTYNFTNAPFYAEKNWGAALPRKWYWTQCNSFAGYNQLSVVAGGGIRKVPFGKEEALGMVSCHYNGTLYEAVPWLGGMSWNVSTWGSWTLRGNSTLCEQPFEIEVMYECNPQTNPGLVFRAPTQDAGLVRFCRDTFEADCTLTLWLLEWDDATQQFVRKSGPPLINAAKSAQGGAEIGGGPWWDDWSGEARLKKPIQALLRLPYRIGSIKQRIRKLIGRDH